MWNTSFWANFNARNRFPSPELWLEVNLKVKVKSQYFEKLTYVMSTIHSFSIVILKERCHEIFSHGEGCYEGFKV